MYFHKEKLKMIFIYYAVDVYVVRFFLLLLNREF